MLAMNRPSVRELRHRFPIRLVAEELGATVPVQDPKEYRRSLEGRILCLMPGHDDTNPSMCLWHGDEGERWNCWSCDQRGGDAFDLVMRVTGCDFNEAWDQISELAVQHRDAWLDEAPDREPARPARPAIDDRDMRVRAEEARERAGREDNRGLLCVAATVSKTRDPDYDDLLLDLGWGVEESLGELVVTMPHRDPTGALVGVKLRRYASGLKTCIRGSRFDHLYGSWRDPGDATTLLLTEGETDFAHALRHLVGDAHVLAMPAGAGQALRSEWVETASGFEDVLLAKDGDEAGDRCTSRWRAALTGQCCVWTCDVPLGRDLRTCGLDAGQLRRRARRMA